MKNLKTLSLLIGLAVLISVSSRIHAASASLTTTTNYSYNLLSVPASVSSVNIASGSGALTVKFYDTTATNLLYTNGSYVSRSTYISNIVNNYTTTTGITNYTTNRVAYTLTVTNAAATNTLPVAAVWSIPANTEIVLDVDLKFSKGIVVNANTNATVNIVYYPLF